MSDPRRIRQLRLGGLFGVASPLVYITMWLVAGAIRPGYDPVSQAISELAEQGSSTKPAMTVGFIAFGLAAFPFAVAVRRLFGSTALYWTAVVCGLGTIGAALFPCSPGCPGPGSTVTDTGHMLFATVGYAALMACPLLAGRITWQRPGWRGYTAASLGIGVVATAGLVVWALGLGGPYGGALQRSFNTLADVWWIGTGVICWRVAAREESAAAGRETR